MVDLKHLPLFPLPLVLFPNSRVPLHIFEDRYKLLISECIERGEEFGVNFVEGSTMFPTGCTARIEEVLQRYDDGRMDVVALGIRRFALESYSKTDGEYLSGRANEVNEILDAPEPGDLLRAIELFNEIVEIALRGEVDPLDPEEWMHKREEFTSYRIAQKCGLEPAGRQRLLEMRSECERITFLIDHMTTLLPQLSEQSEKDNIIRNDGYLQKKDS